jgi:hypothetical protein
MKSSQKMRGVKSGGKVLQKANVPTEQEMDEIDATGDVEQLIEVAGKIDPKKMEAELTKLHEELKKHDPNATAELQRVGNAEAAAKRGDSSGAASSLTGAGQMVLNLAKELGTSIVAKIIEKQMGF